MEADGKFPETVHVPWGREEMLLYSTALEQIIRQLDLLKADKEKSLNEPPPQTLMWQYF